MVKDRRIGTLILCAMYPAPGGDEATWDQIISEFHLVRSRFPSAKVYIMGDGNVHLSSAVQHEQPCKCLHCNQKANDRRIENKLKATGLVILNVGGPTHESGTVIDIGLSLPEHAVSATPLTAGIAASDHCPVLIRVPFIVSEDEHFIVGRVLWSDTEWNLILCNVSQMLDVLIEAIAPLTIASTLRPQSLGGNTSKNIRRALLDLAAWCRDVIYALAGHFAGNVKTNANSTRGSKKPLDPSAYTTFKEFKAAVRAATSDHQRAAAQKYQDLRKSNPGLADRFLSTFFKPKSAFCIALSCPKTGNLLTKAQMVDEWTQNIKSRASTVIDCDPLTSAQNIANITRIRATGAASSALGSTATVGIDDSPYTVQEVTEVVDKMSASKHCLGMPYSALKALCPSGRELTRVLANLGLHSCLTSSRWSVRVLNAVRKAGPHVVRQVNNLRPISLANDMAQVQDALWIRRAAPVLDAFAGEGQLS